MKSKVLIFIVVASWTFGVFPLCHAQVEEIPNQNQARGGPAGFAVADFITDQEATDKQFENSVKNALTEPIRSELAGPGVIALERSSLEPILDELIGMVESGFIKPENAEKILNPYVHPKTMINSDTNLEHKKLVASSLSGNLSAVGLSAFACLCVLHADRSQAGTGRQMAGLSHAATSFGSVTARRGLANPRHI